MGGTYFKIRRFLLCLIMRGIVRVQLHVFFRHWMDASGYHHPPGALLRMKNLSHFGGRLGGVTAGMDAVNNGKFFTSVANRTPIYKLQYRLRYTDSLLWLCVRFNWRQSSKLIAVLVSGHCWMIVSGFQIWIFASRWHAGSFRFTKYATSVNLD